MSNYNEKFELNDQQLNRVSGGAKRNHATYDVEVCVGTNCYINGSDKIRDKLTQLLGISVGQTTADGKFYLGTKRCIGCCGLAPAISINGEVYGKVTEASIVQILAEYK